MKLQQSNCRDPAISILSAEVWENSRFVYVYRRKSLRMFQEVRRCHKHNELLLKLVILAIVDLVVANIVFLLHIFACMSDELHFYFSALQF